ncbi:hypothetical protein BD779DRAFT_804994 [Infundibulicybe gibba]|nr:hypothetical protein BD779DRAFT_804994 [Infundibulicybe gibba]
MFCSIDGANTMVFGRRHKPQPPKDDANVPRPLKGIYGSAPRQMKMTPHGSRSTNQTMIASSKVPTRRGVAAPASKERPA